MMSKTRLENCDLSDTGVFYFDNCWDRRKAIIAHQHLLCNLFLTVKSQYNLLDFGVSSHGMFCTMRELSALLISLVSQLMSAPPYAKYC